MVYLKRLRVYIYIYTYIEEIKNIRVYIIMSGTCNFIIII